MNNNLEKANKKEHEYRILIRNLRKQKEERENEKANNKKTDSNQPE